MTISMRHRSILSTLVIYIVGLPLFHSIQSLSQTNKHVPLFHMPVQAMQALLDSPAAVQSFFSSHFEKSFMHVAHSTRTNRPHWMQHYRRFLQSDDLDLILSYNASSSHPTDPLRLNDDLDVLHVADVDGVYAWRPMAVTGSIDSLRAAVRDGAVLHLYDMSSRSRLVTLFEDALRSFWAVPVSTMFSFNPPETILQAKPAPTIHASDLFLVVLRGSAQVSLYDDYFPSPCSHHIENPSIQSMVYEKCRQPPTNIDVDEGDVLYIPRGVAVDIRTTHSPALILQFEVHTHQRLVFHGLLKAIEMTRRSADLLDQAVYMDDELDNDIVGENAQPTWAQIVSTAVLMAAEFTPAMRRFLPITGDVIPLMEDAGLDVGDKVIQNTIKRFSRAAEDALFDPVLEILASDDHNVEGIAQANVISWAKNISLSEVDTKIRARDTFHACVEGIAQSTSAPHDAVTSMSVDWNEHENEEGPHRMRKREISLQRHG